MGMSVAEQLRMMMKKTNIVLTLFWASLMIPTLLLASGCDRPEAACTLIGCDDQVTIAIHGLEANQFYEVEIATADEIIQCTIDTSEGTNEDMRMLCDKVLLYYSQMNDAYITLTDTPDPVTITILQNGTAIVEDEARPDYHEVAPNGVGCDPICLQATISVEL
jgi:hypothetical protein